MENSLKTKTTEYFLKFLFFYLKVQSFRLIMEYNFIQMDASAGHAVAYMIGTIFKHIIDCAQLYFTNGFTNIVLENFSFLWLVGVTVIFDGTPQIIIQQSAKHRVYLRLCRPVETKCCQYPPLQFLWTKIHSTWPDSNRHWL